MNDFVIILANCFCAHMWARNRGQNEIALYISYIYLWCTYTMRKKLLSWTDFIVSLNQVAKILNFRNVSNCYCILWKMLNMQESGSTWEMGGNRFSLRKGQIALLPWMKSPSPASEVYHKCMFKYKNLIFSQAV